MTDILQIQIAIIHFLQGLGTWLVAPMQTITFLGNEQFFIMVLPILLWCFDYGLGLRVGLILISSGQLFSILKVAFHAPRPFWISTSVKAYSVETSFGLPSGHATNTISIFGQIAIGMKKKWVSWICWILVFLVGFSRVFLGMHFITDVLGGWILGGLVLLVYVRFGDQITAAFCKLSLVKQYAVVVVSSLVWLLLCYGPYLALGAWQIPTGWVSNAIRYGESSRPNPLDISGIYTSVGIWLGLGLGAVWLHHRGGFDAGGTGIQQFERVMIGLAGTLLIWMGLDKVFPGGSDAISLILRLIRYTLVGVWVSGWAPEIFIRLKIARKVQTMTEDIAE
jgi:membrane-associated phospholipid phosphatase